MRTRPGRPGQGGPLIAAFGWLGRHLSGFYTAVGSVLMVGFILAVGLFALIAQMVTMGMTQPFDDAVLLWMDSHSADWLDIAALEVTALGAAVVVWIVVSIASAFLWVSRHRISVLLLWIAVLGSAAINTGLKAYFSRPRPELFPWRTPHAGQSSFPSGHSMGATVAYVTLAYLIARLEPTSTLRRMTYGIAAVVIVLVGLSRMYLGVHYPSDVLAGFVVGFAWAAFCALTIEAVAYFRRRKPGVERAEHDLDGGVPQRS